jgi:PTS system ascorbate-specific IIB component
MRLNTLSICGFGIGSSSMLRLNVMKVLDKMGYAAKGDIADLTSGVTIPFDICFTSTTLLDKIVSKVPPDKKDKVLAIKNYTDHNEIENKLNDFFAKYPFDNCKK